jgi:hypothetical protein
LVASLRQLGQPPVAQEGSSYRVKVTVRPAEYVMCLIHESVVQTCNAGTNGKVYQVFGDL